MKKPVYILACLPWMSAIYSLNVDIHDSEQDVVLSNSNFELDADSPWWPDTEDEEQNNRKQINSPEFARENWYTSDSSVAEQAEEDHDRLRGRGREAMAKTNIKNKNILDKMETTKMRDDRKPLSIEEPVRVLASETQGFCLPPLTATKCIKKGSSCGTGVCCSGLKCINGKCATCTGLSGASCLTSDQCCSSQCVLCSSNARCTGRCGPSAENRTHNIHTFYYPWYGTVAQDGRWRHWASNNRVEGGAYDPTHDDLPSPFFPLLGAYSSNSTSTIIQHMDSMVRAGIGTLMSSWWGRTSFENALVWKLLDAADDRGLKVGFYIEPHSGGYFDSAKNPDGTRTPITASDDVKYIIDTYGCHRAMYRRGGRPVVMFFAAREYKNGAQGEWKTVWDALHANAKYNPIVIAQDLNLNDRIIKGGWDGGHVYDTFAAINSSPNWKTLVASYVTAKKILFLTVSPGYDNSRSRGSTDAIVGREKGALYKRLWDRAISAKPAGSNSILVAITSFNEYHEGTPIEAVIVKKIDPYIYNLTELRNGYTYQDYEGAWDLTGLAAAYSYLDKTKVYADLYRKK